MFKERKGKVNHEPEEQKDEEMKIKDPSTPNKKPCFANTIDRSVDKHHHNSTLDQENPINKNNHSDRKLKFEKEVKIVEK